jgi:hypothetical protein
VSCWDSCTGCRCEYCLFVYILRGDDALFGRVDACRGGGVYTNESSDFILLKGGFLSRARRLKGLSLDAWLCVYLLHWGIVFA